MFATRDQENLVHGHQQLAASKPLNQSTRNAPPKTPGAAYPKTPLKIPLRDENAPGGFGGKSVLQSKGKGLGGKGTDMITPLGTKNRAPLGAKTTNAKAKGFQTPGAVQGKDLNKTQVKPSSTRRLKARVSHADTVKLEIHGDINPLGERDIEYCPPGVQYPKYESEDFPDGCINYDAIRGSNLMRGIQQRYHNPRDENGISIKEKKQDAELERIMDQNEAMMAKAINDIDWSVSDVPETWPENRGRDIQEQLKVAKKPLHKGPATIASRKAASALSAPARPGLSNLRGPTKAAPIPKAGFLARNKTPVAERSVGTTSMRHAAATAASRSTIGYTKGRTACNVLKAFSPPPAAPAPSALSQGLSISQLQPRTTNGLASRSVSASSTSTDATITPARYAKKDIREEELNIEQFRRLKMLGAYDEDDDEELSAELRSEILGLDDELEEFVLETPAL